MSETRSGSSSNSRAQEVGSLLGGDAVPQQEQESRGTQTSLFFRVRTLESLQFRSFRFVWIVNCSHVIGMWALQVILGWLTFEVTNSPFLTAMAIGLQAAPPVILGPIAGVLTDAWDRRKLMIFSLGMQGVIAITFSLFVILDLVHTWVIFTFSLVNGAVGTMYGPALSSVASTVVPRQKLVNAFALLSFADSSTRLFIPITTGVLIAVIGPGWSTAIAGVCILLGTLAGFAVKTPPRQRRAVDPKSAYSDIVQAGRYLWANKPLFGFTIMPVAPLLFITPTNMGLMPVYASDVFSGGPQVLGLLISTLGAGMTLGTLVLASIGDLRAKGPITLITMIGMAIGLFAFSRTDSLVIAIAILLPYSSVMVVYWTIVTVAVQTIVPDELRGRVTSLATATHVAMPIGALTVGTIAQILGVQIASAISAGGLLVFAAGMWILLPQMCRYRSPDSTSPTLLGSDQ